MKIAVYGATGMVGSRLVAEALSRGHQVTAVSRKGTAVESTTAVAAELTDTATFSRLAGEHDAVVISVPTPRNGDSHEPLLQAHRDVIASQPQARIFVVGGAGSLVADPTTLLLEAPGYPQAYLAEALSCLAILDLYRAAPEGVDWTVQSPAPEIAPGERTGKYTVEGDTIAGPYISAEDFAVAALDELETPKFRRARFNAAN
ncbi:MULTISPECIES: NAD(P)H-binding protein [Arthrobacter]|uniref:NAD(P)H-binding protein n=2 Tax=Arthrobacter TaxID=1663 RepID=A0ABU9KJL3_9MICC|nr:NAD(P)H-binding protein [Arthrobacter sp. YJM1]MDP5226659.1 NAD(P)H-binding protein [Arthrobacter sp. YJM1]